MKGVEALDGIIASGAYHEILSIVKGFRNGAVYGKRRNQQGSQAASHPAPNPRAPHSSISLT